MAYAPLLRTNTTPIFPSSTGGVARLQGTMGSTGPAVGIPPLRASQLSGTTLHNSTTSLSSLASASTVVPAQNGGQVVATSNIINQKADASRSLYQICMSLKQRLAQVPGFEEYMSLMDQWEAEDPEGGIVESVWKLLRMGTPLIVIFNLLKPENPMSFDPTPDAKKAKMYIYKFAEQCKNELGIEDIFTISDLLKNDTTGFVKVTTVVNQVLDIAQTRGMLIQQQPYPEDDMPDSGKSKMSYRDYIVRELVDTERKYVQDLENLHDLKKALTERGIVTGDVAYQIFGNIDAILDFQRRFLIRVETTNSMPGEVQQWGSPFVAMEASFDPIYTPFIANQRKAALIAQSEFDKIKSIEHPVACDFNTLDGFLLKPMQRLVKYPLLLKDLLKKSEDDKVKDDLSLGIAAAERTLQKANEAVDRDLLDDALEDLKTRVDDWKNHQVDQFGSLLLHGVHTVLTGKSESERDVSNAKTYEIYLFECILLCCKEISSTKSKDKKDKTKSTGPKIRNKGAKLQLKGRIFMTNVTEVLSLAKPGSYTVQIWWKGDPGVENFIIKFQNEEMMKKWAAALDQQRKASGSQSATSPDQPTAEFAWMRSQSAIENPYAQTQPEEEEEYEFGAIPQQSQQYQAMAGTMPRMNSTASIRGRSQTGESSQSIASIARGPPPRFPLPQPPQPLSVQTQLQGGNSPGFRPGDSYFSPIGESPVSSRTSTASNVFPGSAGYGSFKGVTGQPYPGMWDGPIVDQNRYTAPAMPRAPSRDGPSPVNAYGMSGANGRNPRGPSMPVMASHSAQGASQQSRSRSYSTPDIQGQGPPGMRRTPGGSQSNVPAVPGIPAHLHAAHERHDSNIPRSNTGSPALSLRNDLSMRSNTQSPGVQRDRLMQQGGGYSGGTMAQFPMQPVYPRGGTPNPPGSGHTPAPLNLSADMGRTVSPPLGTGTPQPPNTAGLMSPDQGGGIMPTQLKVKVNYDTSNYMTLVAAYNITYRSLVDRIDAKLARFTNSSISRGNLRLRYRDEEGDFVSIVCDEDVQMAFTDGRNGDRDMYNGGVGEVELFCVGIGGE
ncbi:hypothetical protein MCOR04_009747 [Pyricularia oryzae]|nr:hypothetical protein MCOR04_009747 [Pyricularia oryzae]